MPVFGKNLFFTNLHMIKFEVLNIGRFLGLVDWNRKLKKKNSYSTPKIFFFPFDIKKKRVSFVHEGEMDSSTWKGIKYMTTYKLPINFYSFLLQIMVDTNKKKKQKEAILILMTWIDRK